MRHGGPRRRAALTTDEVTQTPRTSPERGAPGDNGVGAGAIPEPASEPAPASTPAVSPDRANWRMLALAWLVYSGFGIVSSSLPALITPIRSDLRLSYSEVGVLLGAWQLVYIGVSYPAGMFVDRVGTHRALALGAALVALSGLMRAFAADFTTMFLSVAIFGVGGPIISIGVPKVIASWFSGRPRVTASGIYITGSTTGSVLTLASTNSLVLPALGSWQVTCAVYGSIVAGIAATWWLLARDPPRPAARSGGEPAASFREACMRVLTTRAVWLVVIVGFTGFMINHGLRSWLPQILEFKGMSPADAGYLAAVPGVSSIAGSITTARLAAKFGRKPVVATCLITVGASLLAVNALSGPPLIVALAVQGFFAGGVAPILLTILMDMREVGAGAMGAAAGIYFAVGEVGGFSGPSVMGVLKDMTGGFTAGLLLLAAITVVMLIPTALLKDPRATKA
ncbi:MAG: MFS transporter [Chloroflexi bacterium]|nr:MFS transporter [Chloroflexota bacterium]